MEIAGPGNGFLARVIGRRRSRGGGNAAAKPATWEGEEEPRLENDESDGPGGARRGAGAVRLRGGARPTSLDWDPFEEQNRAAHGVNRARRPDVYGPGARAYGTVVPQPVRNGITQLRNNWRLPGQVIQYACRAGR